MLKKKDVFDIELDEEEKELLASVERGEWESVPNLKERIAFAKKVAINTLRRNKAKKC